MERSGGMASGAGVAGPGRGVPAERRVGLPARLSAGVRLGVVCGVWGMLVGADASRPSCLHKLSTGGGGGGGVDQHSLQHLVVILGSRWWF